jgi:hypothetical protein
MTRMQQRLFQESAAVIAVLGMCNTDSADRHRFPSSHRRVTAISMA